MAESAQSEVEVAVVYPHDEFDPSVKGVEPLSADYQAVPKGKLPELRKAAREAGVTLSVRGE